MMDWSSLVGPLLQAGLPALGGLFGGPLGSTVGGIVGKGVAAALGVEPTPQAVARKIEADPSGAAVALAQIEAETKAKEAELADVANARATTVQLAQANSPIAYGAPVVSIVITIGFFALMIMLFFVRVDLPPTVFQLLSLLLGVVASQFAQVGNYWLGSSEASRRNGDAIRGIAASAVTPSPNQVAQSAIAAVRRR